MSDETTHGGHGGTVVQAEGGPFADPGLPPHEHRRTDVDERAARRAERQVAALFGISSLGTIAFIVSFVVIDKEKMITFFPLGTIGALNFALGVSLAAAMLGIGAGAAHWARKLMSDVEMLEERHEQKSAPEETDAFNAELQAGVEDSQLPRRKLIRNSLLGALGLLPAGTLITLADMGPLPQKILRETAWKDHREIVAAQTLQKLKPEDIEVGSLVSAQPKDIHGLNDLAKVAIMIIRLKPEEIRSQEQLDKGYQGILAFSKICTHVGCPLGLYEQTTHHMLCPCHQSTFDLADRGRVIFGPASRSLPQLAITVDDEGYLVAKGDFDEPVGPSFWERG